MKTMIRTLIAQARTKKSWVLVLGLLAAAATSSALQSVDFTYEVNPGGTTVTITDYTGAGGAVVIPSAIDGRSVTTIARSAFERCTSLTSVTIPDSVTSIGSYAFRNCSSLTNVMIPGSVTSIGNVAFSVCSALTAIAVVEDNAAYSSVDGVLFDKNQTTLIQYPGGKAGSYTIPDSVTSIEGYAFNFCNGLTSVTIPDSVTSIGGVDAFRDCSSLTNVTIGSSVTSIYPVMFINCSALTAIVVVEDNAAYSSVDGVVFNKNQTTLILYPGGEAGSYTIPDSVTSIGSDSFRDCSSLTSVTVPDSVTFIEHWAFRGCSSLTNVTIGSGVTSIGGEAFDGCSSLTSVTIPDSVTSIYPYAFRDCSSLTNVMIGRSVTLPFYHGVFENCSALTAITVVEDNAAYSSVDGVLFNKNQTTLILYPGGKAGGYTIPDSVTTVESEAFKGCSSLTSVTIPDSVTSIGGGYAFRDCSSLTNVTIGSSVTSIYPEMFINCPALTAITVVEDNAVYSSVDGVLFDKNKTTLIQYSEGKAGGYTIPDSVTTIGVYAFRDCSSLTSVIVGSSVTSIGYGFIDCSSLTSVTIVEDNAAYSSVDGVLFNKNQTTLIQYPRGKTGSYTIPDSVISIDYPYAFRDCSSLTSVTIGSSITSTSIGIDTFRYCSSLTAIAVVEDNAAYSSVDGVLFNKNQTTLILCPEGKAGSYTIPDSVTFIEHWAFRDCSSLTNVTIGSSVTTIDAEAFVSCSALTSVTIPDSVTSIEYQAFRNCSNLTGVYFKGNAPSVGGPALFSHAEQVTVYYLPGTTGWGTAYADRPTALWNPLIQTDDGNFGVQAGEFGFNIAESESGLVVVKACANLSDDVWVPIHTNTMNNSSFYFSDPDWVNHPTRFYRLSMP